MILSWISLNPGPVSKLIIMRNRSPSTYLSHYGWVGFFCLFVTHNKHNRGRRRALGERIGYPPQYSWVSLVAQSKESTHNAGDLGSILGLGRCPGEGKGYPLFWPGEFHGLYSPWGYKESDITEWLSLFICMVAWTRIVVKKLLKY